MVLGVRRAVAKMEVVIASWIRVTAALEVVPVAFTHTRGTGNSGYGGGVSGASVVPAAVVDHFNPRTDLAPVITVVAASTASNVSSVAFAALPEQMTTAAIGVISKSLLICCLIRS